MEPISNFFIEEKDFLYRKGFKKGFEEGVELGRWEVKVITNMIVQLDLPDERVARIAEVPVSFVKSASDGLKK
jgi:hypothetical protein